MPKIKVGMTKKMGRGVFATRQIKKDEIIEVSPCITWSRPSEDLVQQSELRFYVYSDDAGQSVLALGFGSLFNHSFESHNVTYKYDPATKTITFRATKTIPKGRQLYVNYGYDPIQKYENWMIQQRYRESQIKEQAQSEGVKL